MFGYVLPATQKLEQQEIDRFREAYCGLCHTLKKKYGFAARFLLNYDFTFLAILLMGTEGGEGRTMRCIAHPCKGCRALCSSPALEKAAACCVILSWWQLCDHINDHSLFASLSYRLARWFLRGAYRRAQSDAIDFDRTVKEHLQELNKREQECCASLDAAADPFAALMAEIAADINNQEKKRIYTQLFYQLGRWIYLVDAADDFEKDAKSGNYNPLRYRYAAYEDKLGEEEKYALAQTLDASISRMSAAYVLLDCGPWETLLNSIFYESLYGIGKAVLNGTYRRISRRPLKKNEDNL